MKTMWKKAIRIICVGGLLALCLTGCGENAAGSDSPRIPTKEIQQNNVVDGAQINNNSADNETSNSMGDGAFLYGANLQGSVIEFSDEGFTLSPATTERVEGGGEVLSEAAYGSVNDENNIQISYTDNTVFQIVTFSKSTQAEISREDTDKESVKKQTSVCVFGTCQDTYHWTADKILIIRFQ